MTDRERARGRSGFIAPAPPRRGRERARSTTLGVVTEGPDQLVSDLSGGNQQKVVMGRALASRPVGSGSDRPDSGRRREIEGSAPARVVERCAPRGTRRFWWSSGELEDLRVCDRVLVMRHGRSSPNTRRAGATTSSSRRSRGFERDYRVRLPRLSPSRARLPPRTSAIALARLRDLALLPALVVLLIIGSLISPVFLTSGQHHHHPDLVGGARARRARRIAHHHHRQVRPVARVRSTASRRRSAPWWCCPPRISASASNADRDRHSHGAGRRRPGRLHQRLHGGGAEAQRLHRHARDADHPARHAGRRDQRADAVRPARTPSTA